VLGCALSEKGSLVGELCWGVTKLMRLISALGVFAIAVLTLLLLHSRARCHI
jgi:hypothetical protein